MIATLLQTDIVSSDIDANLRTADRLIDANPGADLYILPEMFASGFIEHPHEADARASALVLTWMRLTAESHSCAIAGSVITEAGGKFYNTFALVKSDGSMTLSHKRHLFTMGGEAEAYAGGQGRVVVDIAGVRCLLLVCYDVRFPVWSRCVAKDYDAIIYVANWPTPRIEVWDVLLRARAIENQAYVIGVNRVGTFGPILYCGHSAVVDPWGKVVARCEDDRESAVQVELQSERVATVRRKFPVWADADAFEMEE